MSDKKSGELVPMDDMGGDLVKANVQYDIDTVVSIKTAQIENGLTKSNNEATAQKKALLKKCDDLNDALGKKVDEEAKAAWTDVSDSMVNAVKAIFSAAVAKKFKPVVHSHLKRDDNGSLFISGDVVGACDMSDYQNQLGSFNAVKHCTAKPSKDVLKIHEDIKSTNEEILKVDEKLVKVREMMARMGQIEKQLRASVAAWSLSQTEQGKELLDKIETADINVPGLDDLLSCTEE